MFFISCSGHGEHRVGKGLDETVMYVKENETVSISSINPRNKRHLVIVDVCRKLIRVETMEETRAAMKAFMKSGDHTHRIIEKYSMTQVMANP